MGNSVHEMKTKTPTYPHISEDIGMEETLSKTQLAYTKNPARFSYDLLVRATCSF